MTRKKNVWNADDSKALIETELKVVSEDFFYGKDTRQQIQQFSF